MKNLVLGVCLMFTSLVFGQGPGYDELSYDLYWIKTITNNDNKIEKIRYIEPEPSPEYFKTENINKWDTVGLLSFISKQVIDSINKLRIKKGLPAIINDDTYSEDEYGYAEECIFDYVGKRQTPLMVRDFYFDLQGCSCINEVISEITSHKSIMKRLLSKRNKVINVCVILDKKTNMLSTYVQVKKLFTFSYFIG